MALRKSIRITKVNLTALAKEQGGETEEMDNAFMELQTSLTISTEKDRAAAEVEANAAIVRAEANIAQAQTASSFLKFLRLASGFSNLVATERNWMPPFRDKDGNLCVENPFTLRDQRAAAHAMYNQMKAHMDSLSEDSLRALVPAFVFEQFNPFDENSLFRYAQPVGPRTSYTEIRAYLAKKLESVWPEKNWRPRG